MSRRLLDIPFTFRIKIETKDKIEEISREKGISKSKMIRDFIDEGLQRLIQEIDVLVGWNLEHMVKLKTIQGVNSISREQGYKEIDIRTSGEMLP